jgi:hypothetical protein
MRRHASPRCNCCQRGRSSAVGCRDPAITTDPQKPGSGCRRAHPRVASGHRGDVRGQPAGGGRGGPSVAALYEMHNRGIVHLVAADTLATERGTLGPNGLVELLGPLVPDHSRLNASVLGTEEDARRLDQVLSIIHPNTANAGAARQRRDTRDALHIATAVRYGCNGFVTSDKGVLRRVSALREVFPLLRVGSPSDAINWGNSEVEKWRRRGGEGEPPRVNDL